MLRHSVSGDYTPPSPAEPIELKGILREHDQTFAVFTAGTSERIVEAEFHEILSFHTFREHLFERFDLRTVYRGGHWLQDVVGAFHRSGVDFDYDDIFYAVWAHCSDLSLVDARWVVDETLLPYINAELARLEVAR